MKVPYQYNLCKYTSSRVQMSEKESPELSHLVMFVIINVAHNYRISEYEILPNKADTKKQKQRKSQLSEMILAVSQLPCSGYAEWVQPLYVVPWGLYPYHECSCVCLFVLLLQPVHAFGPAHFPVAVTQLTVNVYRGCVIQTEQNYG